MFSISVCTPCVIRSVRAMCVVCAVCVVYAVCAVRHVQLMCNVQYVQYYCVHGVCSVAAQRLDQMEVQWPLYEANEEPSGFICSMCFNAHEKLSLYT